MLASPTSTHFDHARAALKAGKHVLVEGWREQDLAGSGGAGAYPRFYETVVARRRAGGPVPVDPRDSRDGLLVLTPAMQRARERRTATLPR